MPIRSPRTSAKASSRKSRSKRAVSSKPQPNECIVPDCGRPAYARGLCQTHHRQLLTTGKLKAIRPYRKRSTGTVKFSGLRLSPECAELVEQYAESNSVSLGAAIAFILEEWLVKRKK